MTSKKRNRRLKKQATKLTATKSDVQLENSLETAQVKTAMQSENKVSPVAQLTKKVSGATQTLQTRYTTLNTEGKMDKIWSSAGILLVLGLTLWLVYGYIPQLYRLTSLGSVEELDKKAAERAEERKKEDERIAGVNQVIMKTNFGDITLDLFREGTPVTTDNFLRLADRGLYNAVTFHRIVESESFAVLQGGDYNQGKKDNKGQPVPSDAALLPTINDEQWKVAPQVESDGSLVNQPEFTVPEAYKDFAQIAPKQTQVTIKKGYVAMAKTSQPNSAGAQFFFTLQDTTLPADYTVFARVNESSLPVLDRITAEIQPVDAEGKETTDGKPNKEIKIESITLSR